MSLNDISLPSHLVVDLYRTVLVGGVVAPEPQKPILPFLGRNAKNILIVVSKSNAPYLPDDELAFLTKVLQACNLGLADIAIVNWNKRPQSDAEAVMKQLKAKLVVLFDTPPEQFGLPNNSPLYTVTSSGDRQFVAAPSLQEIEKTKEAKSQLWVALKHLFCI